MSSSDAADEPIYEPALSTTPAWQQTQVLGLFPADFDPLVILLAIQTHYAELTETVHFTIVNEQNWIAQTQANFTPKKFGEHLWVCPSWHSVTDPLAIVVNLDPGVAFGTGTHPTTALCLEWLANNPPKNKTVIDYGCGSGILAIAAIKLGAKQVIAVDHDPQALEATRVNAERNKITASQLITMTVDQTIEHPVDLLLANILAQPLIELAPLFKELLKPQGVLILSGILSNQTEMVKAAYSRWCEFTSIVAQDEWVRLAAIKTNN
ncbi:MAG: 50S ribosomal protein L11 methyltransferase [Coxiellaceae bacterium]|nr:MAG: 50S ribosomal protein L11 methyltransferase [Coxiellaceae bacterium]